MLLLKRHVYYNTTISMQYLCRERGILLFTFLQLLLNSKVIKYRPMVSVSAANFICSYIFSNEIVLNIENSRMCL